MRVLTEEVLEGEAVPSCVARWTWSTFESCGTRGWDDGEAVRRGVQTASVTGYSADAFSEIDAEEIVLRQDSPKITAARRCENDAESMIEPGLLRIALVSELWPK